MSVATDPRVRARQVAVAREAGHRRLTWLSVALCGVALVVTALVVLHSSLLSARVVRIQGALHETRAEILAATGLGRRPPLADVSTAADAAALERLPWVRAARVVLDWPTGVTVTISERHPVAFVPLQGGTAALVDAAGRVLSRGVPAPSGLVALQGFGSVGLPGSRLSGATQALRLAARRPASLLGRVRAVTASAGSVEVRLLHGPLVLFGSASSLGAKLTALVTVLAKVPLHGIVTVDLRVPSQPVLTR